MDTFFLSHGSPTLSIDETILARHFFRSWVPAAVAGAQAPRAILVVSGHWETTATPVVNVIRGNNDTIHNFYDFPKSMYQLKYLAPGAPDLAKRTKDLLDQAGFGPVKEDHSRGLDHDAWVPLMLMYPEANIPVCQLPVQTDRDGTYHYNLGLSRSDIAAVVAVDPQFLCADVEKNISKRVVGLIDLGVSRSQIARLIPLARCSFRNSSLGPNLAFWLTVFGSFDKLLEAVKVNSGLLGSDLEKALQAPHDASTGPARSRAIEALRGAISPFRITPLASTFRSL